MSECEALYRTILHTAMDGFWLADPPGNLLEVNETYCRMSGYSEQELLGMNIRELEAVEGYTDILAHNQKIMAQGQDRFETRHRRKDGSCYDVEVSVQYRAEKGGRFVSFLRDITGRKQAEDILREREAQLKTTAENTPDAILQDYISGVIKNLTSEQEAQQHFEHLFRNNPAMMVLTTIPDRRFIDVNNAFLSTTGYTRAEVIGKTVADLNLAAQPERLEIVAGHVQAGGHVDDLVVKIRCKDGTIRDGLFWGESISTQGHDYFLSLMIDITERKRAEEALTTERYRLDNIIQGINIGTWEWNVQTGETRFNERWAEMLGYTLEELAPVSISTWSSLTHPEDLEAANRLLEKHFKGELSYYECELRMRHKNGSWVWILDRGKVATWTKEGQPLLMFGMHQDITERQQMEHELKTQRDFATQIINLMGQGLTVTNAEGLFEFVNPAYARLFGYKTADLIGKSPRDITAPESRAALVEQRKLRLAGNTTTYESLLRRVDGSTAPVLITAVPRGSSEHYEGAIAVITDLTEQKQAEDRIIALLHEKEALLKELQHRVKNSFTVITSIIDLMENASQSHEAREALFEVRNRIQAMGTLYDLLYKTDTIIATSLDVYCARVIGSLPLPPHIQVTQSYDPITVPMKTAGPVGLILTELITNVTKYAFPDGRDGKVSVSLQKMDRWVILQVEDDGIGMPAEFDLSQATSLGLTLVQVLADQIQGSFRIERVNGTRCIVEFPG